MRLHDGQIVIFLGDSITRGHFGSNYIGALKRLLIDNAVELDIEFVNAGQDGDMVDDLLRRVEGDVLARGPDWVVVLVGINDVFYESIMMAKLSMDGSSKKATAYRHLVEHFKSNYASLIDAIKGEVEHVAVCTTTAIEDSMSLDIKERLALINDAIKALAQEKQCQLIDLNRAFSERLAELRRKGQQAEFLLTIDGVHLNKRGAQLVADELFDFFVSD